MHRADIIVPLILPVACLWVWQQERSILRAGRPLTPDQLADARRAGVLYPERVRVRICDEIPAGVPPLLMSVGRRLGLVSTSTIGMSLRYGIILRADACTSRRTLVHELAHTAQYERFGGLRLFLRQYLHECLALGYLNSPLEDEAQCVSRTICG